MIASPAAADPQPHRLDDGKREPGKGKSLALAAAVHLLLIGALVLGVQWKSQPPTAVEVEVWRSAAPPTPRAEPKTALKPEPKPEARVEPKPEPKPVAKPDIAIKEDKKAKKEEPKKPEPKVEAKPEAKPEPKKKEEVKPPAPLHDPFAELERETKQFDRQRESMRRADTEARQLNELKAEQSAASRSRGLADYANKLRNKIRGNIVLPPGIQGNPEAVFEVTQLPSGEVISVHVRKSSGNSTLDAAIERAILKSSPLPKPDSSDLFERVLKIPYRPHDE